MRTLFFAFLLLSAPLTCYAARSQAECPPDTIWNSSTNTCYQDPNSPSAKRQQERQRQEAERQKEEQRSKDNADQEAERRRRTGSETVIENPSQPLIIER